MTFLTSLDQDKPRKAAPALSQELALLNPRHPERSQFDHPENNYYDAFPVRPGSDFWVSLRKYRPEGPSAKAILSTYLRDVPFSETLLLPDNVALVRDSRGVPDFQEEVSFELFLTTISVGRRDLEMVVQKRRKFGTQNCTISSVMNVNSSLGRSTEGVFQRFVGSSRQPKTVRVSYKGGQRATAFILTNTSPKFPIDKDTPIEKLTAQLTASSDAPNLLVVRSAAPEICEVHAKLILRLVENYFNLRLESIVVDFIEEDGVFVFVNLKAFRVLSVTKVREMPLALVPVSDSNVVTAEQVEERRKYGFSEFPKKRRVCGCCGFITPKENLNKVMTAKMIYDTVLNVRKRGLPALPFANRKLENIALDANTVNLGRKLVCDLCYSLYVAEHELQILNAKLVKFTSGGEDTVDRYRNHMLVFKKLQQFRLFVFVHSLEANTGSVPLPATLRVNLLGGAAQLRAPLRQANASVEEGVQEEPLSLRLLPIGSLRVFPVFTAPDLRVGNVVPADCVVEVVRKGKLYSGTTSFARLMNLATMEQNHGVHFSSFVVLSAPKTDQLLSLHVTLALKRDNEVESEFVGTAVRKINKHAFLAPNFPYSEPFPDEWLAQVEGFRKLNTEFIEDNFEDELLAKEALRKSISPGIASSTSRPHSSSTRPASGGTTRPRSATRPQSAGPSARQDRPSTAGGRRKAVHYQHDAVAPQPVQPKRPFSAAHK